MGTTIGSGRMGFKTGFVEGAGTYFGDGSDGAVTFDGSTTDGISAGASSYGRYSIDGAAPAGYPVPLAGSNVYEYTVPNKDGSYDGDAVVKQFTSLTIDSGYVLTTDQPCRGLFIMVQGNCTLNGSISMTARGAFADPDTHGGNAAGIRVPVSPVSNNALGEDISGGAIFDGMGSTATGLESSFNSATKDVGAFLTVPKVGMPADSTRTIEPGSDQDMKGSFGLSGDNWIVSTSWGARPTNAGKTGEGGSGRNRVGATAGIAGSVFSGGPGGGGSYFGSGYEGQDYGGAGGPNAAGGDWAAAGGAGNPGGGNSFGSGRGGDGTGGLLILLVGGNLTIGASGGLYAKGVGGGTRLSSGQQVPGSGSGGGAIICAYKGTLSNSGTINVDGGIISTADNSDNTSYPCPQGGAGSYQLINLAQEKL